MKVLLIALTALLFTFPSDINDEKIPWSADNKLTWDHFQGSPTLGNGYVASTNSGISFSFSYSVKNGKMELDYSITSNFYPKLSWYKRGHVSPYILKHEQTHFDISELHARKLRKAMLETGFSLDPKDEINAIYNEVERQRREMQRRFDEESDHSKNEAEEYQWEAYVANELSKYGRWQ